jgi:GT2 family glycosyltransferase
MISSLALSGLLLLVAWMWLRLAKREVSLPLWSAHDIPELAEEESPLVSVILAAPPDDQALERCIQALLRQDYPRFEIVVAAPSGAAIRHRLPPLQAAGGRAVRILELESPPPAGLASAAALQRGAEGARGEWLVFTTAEAYPAPTLLSRAMAYARVQGLGLLSLAPRPACRTFWEHVCLPVAWQYLDLIRPMSQVSAPQAQGTWASEAFVLVCREAYVKAGGHAAVGLAARAEDGLMRRLKALGYRVEFVKALDLLQVRSSRPRRDLWQEIGRALGARLGPSRPAVAAHAIALGVWTVSPFLALIPAFAFGFWGLDAVQGWWEVVFAVCAILAAVTVLQAQSVLRRVHRQNHFYTATLPLGGLCVGAALLWGLRRGGMLEHQSPARPCFSAGDANEVDGDPEKARGANA